jgi:hypothetical protein
MAVKAIKLITGEELISEYTTEGSQARLTNPVLIVLRQENPAFIPWMPYVNEPYIDMSAIIAINEPIIEVVNAYNQYFGSGIQVVQASSLLKG